MVFPLKALPWLFAIALIAMGMEAQTEFGLLGILAGLGLLGYLVKQKWFSGSRTSSAAPTRAQPGAAAAPPVQQPVPPPATPAQPVCCPGCKAAVPAGMAFCMQCGMRVR